MSQDEFLLDLVYGVAIHEARHLADSVDEPVLTERGKAVFKGFTPRALKSLIAEVRAYFSMVIECPECTASMVASMAGHLPKRAAGSSQVILDSSAGLKRVKISHIHTHQTLR